MALIRPTTVIFMMRGEFDADDYPNNHTTGYRYDALNRKTQEIMPGSAWGKHGLSGDALSV